MSRRPNRAAVTPIRQQNPPGPLKLLGLREKTGKNTDFDFAQITLNILVAHLPQRVLVFLRKCDETVSYHLYIVLSNSLKHLLNWLRRVRPYILQRGSKYIH